MSNVGRGGLITRIGNGIIDFKILIDNLLEINF